jgi:undecaprenyl-diphosphatase
MDYGAYSTFFEWAQHRPQFLTILLNQAGVPGRYSVLGVVVLAAAALLLVRRRTYAALFLVGIVLAGLVFAEGAKLAVRRPAPREGRVELGPEGWGYSFPSGNALLTVVTYGGLALIVSGIRPHWRRRVVLFGVVGLLALLVGASHIILYDAYVTDVLAGWAGGLAILFLGSNFAPAPAHELPG